jgi:phosphatidate cytidylyltransferase
MIFRFGLTIAGLFVVGAVLMVLTHRVHETTKEAARGDWIKYAVFAAFVAIVLTAGLVDRWFLAWLLAVVAIESGLELARPVGRSPLVRLLVSTAGLGVIALCLSHLLFFEDSQWWSRFAFVFVLVATCDSFAQLWGRLLGKHRLCPTISPGKTWEGVLGGAATVIALALSLGFMVPDLSATQLAWAGGLVVVTATAGDLLFSAIKRRLNLKDFSSMLPGHGGMLDRFDSLIATAPVFYWMNRLFLS